MALQNLRNGVSKSSMAESNATFAYIPVVSHKAVADDTAQRRGECLICMDGLENPLIGERGGPSVWQFVYLSIYLPIRPSIYLSICLSVCLPVCLSVHLSISPSLSLFCSVLFCSVLFCSVLLCSVLFCSVLFCSVLSVYVSIIYLSISAGPGHRKGERVRAERL